MDRHDEMALCHRRIAEAHAALAELLEGISQLAAVAAPRKHKAFNGRYLTAQEWRCALHMAEDTLLQAFGASTFSGKSLRNMMLNHVVLSPGDLELYHSSTTPRPRWWANLQSAIDCMPHLWPDGRAVIVRTETRGVYQLTGAIQ